MIGMLIRRRREQARISITGLARTAGVNFRTLKSLENGETRPWDATAAKIEKALGWQPGALELLRESDSLLERVIKDPDSLLADQGAGAEDSRPAVAAAFSGDALDQLRNANIAVAAQRMARLPAEDIARVQNLIDELGRARFPDWDDDGDYTLAWGRRAILRPLAPTDEQAVLDSLKDVD